MRSPCIVHPRRSPTPMVAIGIMVGGAEDHRRSMLRATFEDETRCEAVLLGPVCDLKVQSWRVQYQSSRFLLFMTSTNKNDQVVYHSRANGALYIRRRLRTVARRRFASFSDYG